MHHGVPRGLPWQSRVPTICGFDPGVGFIPPLHFLFHDKTASLALELRPEGLSVVDNPVGVGTNPLYLDWHLTNLRQYTGLTGGRWSYRLRNNPAVGDGPGHHRLHLVAFPAPTRRHHRRVRRPQHLTLAGHHGRAANTAKQSQLLVTTLVGAEIGMAVIGLFLGLGGGPARDTLLGLSAAAVRSFRYPTMLILGVALVLADGHSIPMQRHVIVAPATAGNSAVGTPRRARLRTPEFGAVIVSPLRRQRPTALTPGLLCGPRAEQRADTPDLVRCHSRRACLRASASS